MILENGGAPRCRHHHAPDLDIMLGDNNTVLPTEVPAPPGAEDQ